MSILIRKAEEKDAAAMMNLIKELAVYEKEPDAVTATLEHFTESGFGENPVWWAIVAENESKEILGMALWYIRYSTWKGQRMYLEDLVVTQSARKLGIGSLLFDELINIAKQKNYSGIVWQVLEWNEPAINFYKKYNADLDAEWINCSIEL